MLMLNRKSAGLRVFKTCKPVDRNLTKICQYIFSWLSSLSTGQIQLLDPNEILIRSYKDPRTLLALGTKGLKGDR